MPIGFGSVHTQITADGTSGLTLTGVTGGTDQHYVVGIFCRLDASVDTIRGGSLVWNEQIQQRGFRNQVDTFLYNAAGSPSEFNLEVFTTAVDDVSVIAARYTGAGSTAANIRVSNFSAEIDGPGTDLLPANGNQENSLVTISMTPSSANSTIVVVTNTRNRVINIEDVNYTERATADANGVVRGYLHDVIDAGAGTTQMVQQLNANADSAVAGLVLQEATTSGEVTRNLSDAFTFIDSQNRNFWGDRLL